MEPSETETAYNLPFAPSLTPYIHPVYKWGKAEIGTVNHFQEPHSDRQKALNSVRVLSA